MDVRSSFVHGVHKKFHESVHLNVVVAVIGYLKGVIEENVSCKAKRE